MAERQNDDTLKKVKDSAEKRHLKIRKERLQTESMSRRKLFAANVGEFDIQINEPKEVKEDSIYDKMKEGPSVNAHLELSKCKRRRKHCRKKCWNCRSSSHFKNRCPYLRCFFCHKMGHLKKNCHLKMLEYIYNKRR